MRKCIFLLAIICSATSFAQGFGDAYEKINSASRTNARGESLHLNLAAQTLYGDIVDSVLTKLSNEDIKKQNPDAKVELTRDLFESGFDILGGVVTGEESLLFCAHLPFVESSRLRRSISSLLEC